MRIIGGASPSRMIVHEEFIILMLAKNLLSTKKFKKI